MRFRFLNPCSRVCQFWYALKLFLGTENRSEAGQFGQIALLKMQSRFNLEVWVLSIDFYL